ARQRPTSVRHRASICRPHRGARPTRVPSRSPPEAYPRCVREVELAHPLRTESEKLLARGGRVGDERCDIDGLTTRCERAETLEALFETDRRAVEGPSTPAMKPDAHLQDPVAESGHRGRRGA